MEKNKWGFMQHLNAALEYVMMNELDDFLEQANEHGVNIDEDKLDNETYMESLPDALKSHAYYHAQISWIYLPGGN